MGRKRGVQYRAGSFYRSDDRSGFTQRAGNTKKEWTGLIVDESLWEARQPQDFVKGVADDQTVPAARPIPPNVFVGPFSIELAEFAPVGATIVFLDNLEGLSTLDPVGVMMDLDGGAYFRTHISFLNFEDNSVVLAAPLPYFASAGNILTDFLTPRASGQPGWAMDFSNPVYSGYIPLIAGAC